MLHRDILKRLFPIDLAGAFDGDTEVEGAQLDAAQARAEQLLREEYPDLSVELLPAWERVCGLIPGAEDTIKSRQDRVIRKLRERGGLSREYFIALAAAMGWTITIEELQPFMSGIGRAGDVLYVPGVRFIWRVSISGQPLYYFRSGQSAAGERLLWWPLATELENLLQDLKPAHTYIIFDYS